MKRTIRSLVLNICIASVIVNISCNNTSVEKQVEFYYYPKSNVYYDVEKNAYLYSLNGGKSWQNLTITSENPPSTLGEKIVLYSHTDSIWKDNEAHRKLYAGVLYNVMVEDSSIASAATQVSERRTMHKTYKSPTVSAEQNVKKEKPLRRFLNRIFGKRKKQE